MNFPEDLTKLIDKAIETNKKYREIAKERILEKEKILGRLLTFDEIREIFEQIIKEYEK